MVDMDSGGIGWLPQIKSWANKTAQKNSQLSSLLEKMIMDFLTDALAVVKLCTQPLYVSDQSLVSSMLNIVDCHLSCIITQAIPVLHKAASIGDIHKVPCLVFCVLTYYYTPLRRGSPTPPK